LQKGIGVDADGRKGGRLPGSLHQDPEGLRRYPMYVLPEGGSKYNPREKNQLRVCPPKFAESPQTAAELSNAALVDVAYPATLVCLPSEVATEPPDFGLTRAPRPQR
jgi:hypothetical protein